MNEFLVTDVEYNVASAMLQEEMYKKSLSFYRQRLKTTIQFKFHTEKILIN